MKRQVCSWATSREMSAVEVNSKKVCPRNSRNHFRSSALNLVVSIDSVDAVTIPRVSPAVVIAHSTIQHTRAVLPIPWPEATAICIACQA